MQLRSSRGVDNRLKLQLYSIRKVSSSVRAKSPLSLIAKHTFFVEVEEETDSGSLTQLYAELERETSVLSQLFSGLKANLLRRLRTVNATKWYTLRLPYIDTNKLVFDTVRYDNQTKNKFVDALNRLAKKHTPKDNTLADQYEQLIRDVEKNLRNVLPQDAHKSSLLGLSNAFANQFVSNNIEPITCNSSDAKFMLRLFCAAHNTATLISIPRQLFINDSAHCKLFLALKEKISKQQQTFELPKLRSMLWQSLVTNPSIDDRTGIDEFLNFDMFQTRKDPDTMNNAIAMINTNGNLDMQNGVMNDTGLYFADQLLNKSNAQSNRQMKCMDGYSNYWEVESAGESSEKKESEIIAIDNDECDTFLRTRVLGFSDRTLVLKRPENSNKISNSIVRAYQDIMPGQAVSWMSNYGTQIDLLVKQFFTVWAKNIKHVDDKTVENLKSDLLFFMADLPELVYVCACTVLENMLKEYTDNDMDNFAADSTEYIDSSKPGFLFNMLYTDGKFIGIHADTILAWVGKYSSDNKLIVGELKTKWTLTKEMLNSNADFLAGYIDESTVNDHIHQAMCQGIVAFCMWAKSRDFKNLMVHLFALAVPFIQNVVTLYQNSYVFNFDLDAVGKLACNLYASLLFTTVCIRNLNAFVGYTDKYFFVPRSSSLMLWVINALARPKDDEDPSIFPIVLIDPFDLDKSRSLELPTFTSLAFKQFKEDVNVNSDSLPPFIVDFERSITTWCVPLSVKYDDDDNLVIQCILFLPKKTIIKKDSVVQTTAETLKPLLGFKLKTRSKAVKWYTAEDYSRSPYYCTFTLVIDTNKSELSVERYSIPSTIVDFENKLTCIMLPLASSNSQLSGEYVGALLQNESDEDVTCVSVTKWFGEECYDKSLFAQYSTLYTNGKIDEVFESCSLLAIDDVCKAYNTAGTLITMSETSQTKLDHIAYFLQFYCSSYELGDYKREWPFNLVRNIVKANATTITLAFAEKDRNKPVSVLAPFTSSSNAPVVFRIYRQQGKSDTYELVGDNPLRIAARGRKTKEIVFYADESDDEITRGSRTVKKTFSFDSVVKADNYLIKKMLVGNPTAFKKPLSEHQAVHQWLKEDGGFKYVDVNAIQLKENDKVIVTYPDKDYDGVIRSITPAEIQIDFENTYAILKPNQYKYVRLAALIEHANTPEDLEHAQITEGINLPITMKYFAI